MGLKLKGNRNQIPSGILFVDPRTGREFNPYERGLNETIRHIIAHRSQNKTFYPSSDGVWLDPDSVRQEVLSVVYSKRPDLFDRLNSEQQIPIYTSQRQSPNACSSCGFEGAEPVYCPTCSGRRITGYKCTNCGKVRRK